MSESVKLVSLEHFRGLPNTEFDLGGKNIVILGSNGKGKSGLVDGFEYLFSGQVGRFVGSGTQGINHDEAVCHIRRGGTPKVSVTLSPSRAVVSRTLGTDAPTFCQRHKVKPTLMGIRA
ncbi:ATP-binding protein [Verrucomicrobium spinosum]|uniref:ATP-binding protein n=1 Tax=Verrucomicrobium spinosum TaxID=2736 RepID=UPI0009463C4F